MADTYDPHQFEDPYQVDSEWVTVWRTRAQDLRLKLEALEEMWPMVEEDWHGVTRHAFRLASDIEYLTAAISGPFVADLIKNILINAGLDLTPYWDGWMSLGLSKLDLTDELVITEMHKRGWAEHPHPPLVLTEQGRECLSADQIRELLDVPKTPWLVKEDQ